MHLKSTGWGVGRKSGSEGGLVLKVIDYIRNSCIGCFYSLLASTGIMARLAAHTTAPNPRTNPPCTTTTRLRFLHCLPPYIPLTQYILCILYSK